MAATAQPASRATRVLIVDDERNDQQLLGVILETEGFLFDIASSGSEALAIVARQPPDLVLLDVLMPGMDGHEVALALKANPTTRSIPIIMLTALGDRKDRMLGLVSGADEYLSKPVDRDELCARIRNLSRLNAYTVDDRSQAALLELAQDAIIVQDMRDRIVLWNRGAETLFGWTSAAARGRDAYQLLATEWSTPWSDIKAMLLQGEHWVGEATHVTRGGSRVTVCCRFTLQRDDQDNPIRILSISSDITARKADEAQLRSAELAVEELRREQLKFKDEFLSHVSHELRSPLTAIKQFTNILLAGSAGMLNTEQREYQMIVLRNIQQLQSMIDDLLEVTGLETGKLAIDRESVVVASAVNDSYNTLQGTAHDKGVSLVCDVRAGLASVFADPTRLRQILIILLDNAVKFTPTGGEVRLSVRASPEDENFVLFEVSDTGCGVPPEVGEQIFERLYQESAQLATSRKGLGLGLYICKELVTRHGGSISAQCRAGGGTTMAFTLPAFSLDDLIAPLYRDGAWPNAPAVLVVARSSSNAPWASNALRDEWCQEARALLQRCMLPDLDVLLPTVRHGTLEELFPIAAFADDAGVAVLVNRIHAQFARLLAVKSPGVMISVSGWPLPPTAPEPNGSGVTAVHRMAERFRRAVHNFTPTQEVAS